MSDIEYDNDRNDLEVEITDLELPDEGGNSTHWWLAAQSVLTKIHWGHLYTSGVRTLLLIAFFLIPLTISTSYSTHHVSVLECVRQPPKVVYVSSEKVTSSGTTLTVIAITVQRLDNTQQGYIISGTSSICR